MIIETFHPNILNTQILLLQQSPDPVAKASLVNLLEMQIPQAYLRHPNQKTRGTGTRVWDLANPHGLPEVSLRISGHSYGSQCSLYPPLQLKKSWAPGKFHLPKGHEQKWRERDSVFDLSQLSFHQSWRKCFHFVKLVVSQASDKSINGMIKSFDFSIQESLDSPVNTCCRQVDIAKNIGRRMRHR